MMREISPLQLRAIPAVDFRTKSGSMSRDQTTLRDIMRARFNLAKLKGFDAVQMDNIDGYTNNPGFSFSAGDQLVYNLWLASAVHSIGLAAFLKMIRIRSMMLSIITTAVS